MLRWLMRKVLGHYPYWPFRLIELTYGNGSIRYRIEMHTRERLPKGGRFWVWRDAHLAPTENLDMAYRELVRHHKAYWADQIVRKRTVTGHELDA